jgi:hypothetical protein
MMCVTSRGEESREFRMSHSFLLNFICSMGCDHHERIRFLFWFSPNYYFCLDDRRKKLFYASSRRSNYFTLTFHGGAEYVLVHVHFCLVVSQREVSQGIIMLK